MYILNIEDNVMKHNSIRNAISSGGFGEIQMECVGSLEEGLKRIHQQYDAQRPFDLIITDMWYPQRPGEADEASGEKLIEIICNSQWKVPIILCSSVNYKYPEILGCVHFSRNQNWEQQLVALIKTIA